MSWTTTLMPVEKREGGTVLVVTVGGGAQQW